MRYCLISDIHSNLEAFQAVLEAASKEGIDRYLCVGDVVGYGADPQTAIMLVKSLEPEVLIAGNHDWGVLGLLDLEYFNEYAEAAVIWTQGILNKDERDYLKSFRLVYDGDDFTLVHGSLDEPSKFRYILDADDAYTTMKLMKRPLCFVGHSHVPGIFHSEKNKIVFIKGAKVKIDQGGKYVVNIGSVGQPRDGDPRASFAIYDTGTATVEIKRVAYDIKGAQEKILKANLPEHLAIRLAGGR